MIDVMRESPTEQGRAARRARPIGIVLAESQAFLRRESIQIRGLHFRVPPADAVPAQVVREQVDDVRFCSSSVPDWLFFTFERRRILTGQAFAPARRLGAQLGRVRVRGLRRVPRKGDVGVEQLQGRDEAEEPHEQARAALHLSLRRAVLAASPRGLAGECWLQLALKVALLRALGAIRSEAEVSQKTNCLGRGAYHLAKSSVDLLAAVRH